MRLKCRWFYTHESAIAAENENVVRPKMPAFDYSPLPYEGPSADETMKKRQRHLNPCMSYFYKSPNSDGIPLDLFISKKKKNDHLNGFNLKFTDSSSSLVFSVDRPRGLSQSLPILKRLVFDSSGIPVISIAHNQKETWRGFIKDSNEEKDLMFTAERTKNTFTRVEFQVFSKNGNPDNPKKSNFEMRGSPFYRSCTIYKGDSIIAQTSLMYKLGIGKVLVPRNRFRVTIFPGYADHAFIVALITIFFYGRKLWI